MTKRPDIVIRALHGPTTATMTMTMTMKMSMWTAGENQNARGPRSPTVRTRVVPNLRRIPTQMHARLVTGVVTTNPIVQVHIVDASRRSDTEAVVSAPSRNQVCIPNTTKRKRPNRVATLSQPRHRIPTSKLGQHCRPSQPTANPSTLVPMAARCCLAKALPWRRTFKTANVFHVAERSG